MKNVRTISAILFAFISSSFSLFAQTDDDKEAALYSKAHIAFTNFKILGFNSTSYARCVESINFQDPAKNYRVFIVGETVFADDGKQYDLKAGDGILTSTDLFTYADAVTPVEPGQYRNTKQNPVIYDQSFEHVKNQGLEARLKIECNIVWLPCSQMTGPQQALCNIIGWPWGIFILKDCKITWG